jgi:hypothetical protein
MELREHISPELREHIRIKDTHRGIIGIEMGLAIKRQRWLKEGV